MEFKDEKKEYEIVFANVRNKGFHSTPIFKLTIKKPFEAAGFFEWDDIRRSDKQGISGIAISKYSDIAEALKSKKDVLVTVSQEALEFVFEANKKEIENIKEEAKKDPERWFWAFGGDTHELIISPDSETRTEFRKDLEKISKILKNKISWRDNPLKNVSKPVERGAGVYTLNGWFEISHKDLMNIYNVITGKIEAKKAIEQAEKEKIFAKAKETGEKQILETYSVECNDPDESCDVDNIIIYAMPDGTTKETRIHTY